MTDFKLKGECICLCFLISSQRKVLFDKMTLCLSIEKDVCFDAKSQVNKFQLNDSFHFYIYSFWHFFYQNSFISLHHCQEISSFLVKLLLINWRVFAIFHSFSIISLSSSCIFLSLSWRRKHIYYWIISIHKRLNTSFKVTLFSVITIMTFVVKYNIPVSYTYMHHTL